MRRTLFLTLALLFALSAVVVVACGDTNDASTKVNTTSVVGGQPPQPTNNPCAGSAAITGSPSGLAAASPTAATAMGSPGASPTGNGMVAVDCGSPSAPPGNATGTAGTTTP